MSELENAGAEQILAWAWAEFGEAVALSTSFQRECMILLDMASRVAPGMRVFTLDTGRLPEETYQMIETTRQRYGVTVEIAAPDAAEVESMVTAHGPNLFYREPALRSLCCHVRKVRPLERKLEGLRAWVTGLRREQAESRAAIPKAVEAGGKIKLNPLADWSAAEVEDYARRHNVPEHALYARGYRSIGCGPCTRAVAEGEGERAGRWWWEEGHAKECGIHVGPDGRVTRRVEVLIEEVLAAKAAPRRVSAGQPAE